MPPWFSGQQLRTFVPDTPLRCRKHVTTLFARRCYMVAIVFGDCTLFPTLLPITVDLITGRC